MNVEKVQAKLIVDPDGSRRLRIGNDAVADARPVVTLAQILLDEIPTIPATPDGSLPEVRVRPLNMLGLAMLEARFGSIEKIPTAHPGDIAKGIPPTDISWADKQAILACLINQDRKEGQRLTNEEVGQLVSVERMEIIDAALEAATRPLADYAQAKAIQIAAALAARAGLASSTTSSSSSESEAQKNSASSPSGG